MALSTTSELLSNQPFMGRVAAAVLLAAGDIRNQTTNFPANHASRLAWAESIDNYGDALQIAGWYAPQFVAADQDLVFAYEQASNQADIGDASIINGVNSQIDNDADERFPIE